MTQTSPERPEFAPPLESRLIAVHGGLEELRLFAPQVTYTRQYCLDPAEGNRIVPWVMTRETVHPAGIAREMTLVCPLGKNTEIPPNLLQITLQAAIGMRAAQVITRHITKNAAFGHPDWAARNALLALLLNSSENLKAGRLIYTLSKALEGRSHALRDYFKPTVGIGVFEAIWHEIHATLDAADAPTTYNYVYLGTIQAQPADVRVHALLPRPDGSRHPWDNEYYPDVAVEVADDFSFQHVAARSATGVQTHPLLFMDRRGGNNALRKPDSLVPDIGRVAEALQQLIAQERSKYFTPTS